MGATSSAMRQVASFAISNLAAKGCHQGQTKGTIPASRNSCYRMHHIEQRQQTFEITDEKKREICLRRS